MPKVRKRNDSTSRLRKRKRSVKTNNDYRRIQYQAVRILMLHVENIDQYSSSPKDKI